MTKNLLFLLGLLFCLAGPSYAANFASLPLSHTEPTKVHKTKTAIQRTQTQAKRQFKGLRKHKLASSHHNNNGGTERFLRYAIICFLLALPLAFIIVGFILPLVWMWISGFALLLLYVVFLFLFLTMKMSSKPSIDVKSNSQS